MTDDASPTVAGDAAAHGIAALCERHSALCASAVDPFEICSALEFEGLTDRAARKRYGKSDVFALAEEMYRRVPRRPAEPAPQPEQWPLSFFRPVLHGFLYGVPTMLFAASTGLLTGGGVLTVLIVAMVTSWGFSQWLAYAGYLRLGRGGRTQAARVLRVGMAAGVVVAAAALAPTAAATSAHTSVLLFGAGLAAYMLGATVLMVLGREWLLLAALAPGVLGASAYLLLGHPRWLEHATWFLVAATPLLALGLAAGYTTRDAGRPRIFRRRGGGAAPSGGIVVSELLDALPSAGFGLLAAGLLLIPISVGGAGHGRANEGALLASLPLALSMGAAEWALVWYRRQTQRLLRATWDPRAFADRARLLLAGALLQYLAVAVALTAASAAVAAQAHLIRLHSADLPQVFAYMALGCAMFVSLLLQAFNSRFFPLIACAVALAFEVAYRGLGVPAQIWACTELLIVLTGYAGLILGSAVRHAP